MFLFRSKKPASRAEHVFAAARLEDAIRVRLLEWQDAPAGATPSALAQADLARHLADLHTLNRQHFDDAPGIRRTLDALAEAIARHDAPGSWQAFLALAERPGDNFGTWAI